jgi:superfamily I DNA/RNA helicase/RecB family exonuclease
MQLTAAQQRVVDHREGRVCVRGAAGTGKTTALAHHYVRLSRSTDASRVLVLCRNRSASIGFRDAVLPDLAGGFDALPITTYHGVAHDLVARARGPVRLLLGAEQRALVRELLDAEGEAEWPTLHPLLGRTAFVDEVSEAVLAYQAALAPARASHDDRWRELAAFTTRYLDVLDGRGSVDASGLLVQALASGPFDHFDHVLVDDHEAGPPVVGRLLGRLTEEARSVCVTGVHLEQADVELTTPFRHLERHAELVRCGHPAVEAEAIAGELLAARADGVEWGDMAVLLRRPWDRGPAVARALARHRIPVTPVPGVVTDEPVVRAIIDMLRWVNGDAQALERLLVSPLAGLDITKVRDIRRRARTADGGHLETEPELSALVRLRDHLAARAERDDPAALAYEIWRRVLAPAEALDGSGSPGDDRALDAVVAFLDGLRRHTERNPGDRLPQYIALLDGPVVEPDPWRVVSGASADAVTITSIAAAAGREWDTVVVSGCVEGELPAVHSRVAFFDRARLEDADVPSVAARRRRSLDDERRLFEEVACTRASRRLVGTAAPEAGVLLSRFVESWPARAPDLPLAPGRPPVDRPPTAGSRALYADGQLRLSASRLDTYDDCPLRYAYQYVLHVRREAGVQAALGSVFHEVLAEFLDPRRSEPRTREALTALARGHWRDDIARYRPQAEEARRDYYDMLDRWWEAEGSLIEQGIGPEVLDVEREFSIEVGPHTVNGFIDRIDRADDGTGIRIVDYKTGKKEPSTDEMADNLQLAVYHLAASRDEELMALGPPTQLRLLYPRTMKYFDQQIVAGHAEATEARVLAAAGHILDEAFEPSVHANCRYCSFHRLCPLQREGREVGDA